MDWDAEFVKVDEASLFDLLNAANYLSIKNLVDLTCETIADMIRGTTLEEICKMFSMEKNLNPEEEGGHDRMERIRSRNRSESLILGNGGGDRVTTTLTFLGMMKGHYGWVTAIAVPPANEDFILSSSRDKSVIIWSLTRRNKKYGSVKMKLWGHVRSVQDVAISPDGQFAFSGSWDGSLCLWNIKNRTQVRRFRGHVNDVVSVSFSSDSKLLTAYHDTTVQLWDTLGNCWYSIRDPNAHDGWVSCVSFFPRNRFTNDSPTEPLIVSAGWDKVSKVWNQNICKISLRSQHKAKTLCHVQMVTLRPVNQSALSLRPSTRHNIPRQIDSKKLSMRTDTEGIVWKQTEQPLRTSLVNYTEDFKAITISLDNSLCASGGTTGIIMIWSVSYPDKEDGLYTFNAGATVYALRFSPKTDLLCAATRECIKVWHLNNKSVIQELRPDFTLVKKAVKKAEVPYCVSLNWSADGSTLYSGYTDGRIRVWGVPSA